MRATVPPWCRRGRGAPAWVAVVALVLAGVWAAPPAATADPTADVPPPQRHYVDTHGPLDRALDPDTTRYERPVAGAVRQSFRPPGTMFGPGHRGVDLDAPVGTTVLAAAEGVISFAGAVGGRVWVSIHHRDQVVTSYGPLADLQVRGGDPVARGAPLGVVAPGGHGHLDGDTGLHWGARRDGIYFDPLTLLDDHLSRASLLGVGEWEGSDHRVVPYEPWGGGWFNDALVRRSPKADRQGFATPPNPNHLVLLAGLQSNSNRTVIDADHLGYGPESITRFSYAGRHDAGGEDDDPRRDQLPYDGSDTWEGIDQAAQRLAEQLRAQAKREPGRAVDLVGHSLGGLVILQYLARYHDPYDRSLPPIGHVVTIASPLRGSDVASAGTRLRDARLVRWLHTRWNQGNEGHLPLDAPVLDELAVQSPQLRELAAAWEDALARGAAGPLGTGTRVLTIGASRDQLVPTPRSRQPSSAPGWGDNNPTAMLDGEQVVDHRVLPGGHTSVLDTEAIREVVWRFLAGDQVVESPGHRSMYAGRDRGDKLRTGAELLADVLTLWGRIR